MIAFIRKALARCVHCGHPRRLHSPHGGFGCSWHYHDRVQYKDDRGRTRLLHFGSVTCACPLSIDEVKVN